MAEPILEPRMVGMTLCHGVPGRWMRMLAAMTATPNLEWFLKELGSGFSLEASEAGTDLYEHLEEMVNSGTGGFGRCNFHPYLFPGGERGPFVKPSARASFSGLNLNHTSKHLLRAVAGRVQTVVERFGDDRGEETPLRQSELRVRGQTRDDLRAQEVFERVVAEERREQRRTGGSGATRRASRTGTPSEVSPWSERDGSVEESPMIISVKKMPMESTWPEFWNVEFMPIRHRGAVAAGCS